MSFEKRRMQKYRDVMKAKAETIRDYFMSHPCTSMYCVEAHADIPIKTISHFMSGRRGLADYHIHQIIEVLRNYGFESGPYSRSGNEEFIDEMLKIGAKLTVADDYEKTVLQNEAKILYQKHYHFPKRKRKTRVR